MHMDMSAHRIYLHLLNISLKSSHRLPSMCVYVHHLLLVFHSICIHLGVSYHTPSESFPSFCNVRSLHIVLFALNFICNLLSFAVSHAMASSAAELLLVAHFSATWHPAGMDHKPSGCKRCGCQSWLLNPLCVASCSFISF